jgi:hypothetical protein
MEERGLRRMAATRRTAEKPLLPSRHDVQERDEVTQIVDRNILPPRLDHPLIGWAEKPPQDNTARHNVTGIETVISLIVSKY